MKSTSVIEVEADAAILVAEMEPRYWEDARVDGVAETDEDPRIPLRNGDLWILRIALDEGRILDWPDGVTAETHYKVCDAGTYRILDAEGAILAEREGYVPPFLAPGGHGYGDYVIVRIGPDGRIDGWNPDLSWFNE
jgi:hypothetical protein